MDIFNVNKFNNRVICDVSKYGKVSTNIMITGSLETYKKMDLIMQDNEYNDLTYIYTSIANHKVHIIDFISLYENQGYGMLVLKHLIDIVFDISHEYSIHEINGMLSTADFSNRRKLVHMYSTICPKARFSLNAPLDEVLSNSNRHFFFAIDISRIQVKK